MKKIIVILLIVVAIIAGAGGTFVILRGTKAGAHAVKKELPTVNLPLDERTVNLADMSGEHYARLTLVLEVAGEGDIEKESEDYKPQLYDTLLDIISRYTYRTLLTPDGKKKLKEELIEGFGKRLKPKGWEVKDVLFSDFVME